MNLLLTIAAVANPVLTALLTILVFLESKKSKKHWSGRNEQNTVVVFPKENFKIGDFVNVKIHECTSATLIGKAL